jgi:hypothetical protein
MSELTNDLTGGDAGDEYLFDASRGVFWKRMEAEWIELREAAMRRELMKKGMSHKVDPAVGKISPLDDELRTIEQDKRVRRAIEVAGYRAGVVQMGPDRILVPRAAPLIVPSEGDWRLLAAFFEGLFVGDEIAHVGDKEQHLRYDQRHHVWAWLKHWLEALYEGRPTSGLFLHLAGMVGCGKSRFAALCKELSGGRVGKPYRYMIGRDDFNRELFEASLQLVDDEQADTSREARKEFGGQLKLFTANEDLKLRGMHADGFNLKPCWRVLIATNLEEAALLVMPQITADIEDKGAMLKGYVRDRVPVTPAEMEEYRRDHPALAAWWDHALAQKWVTQEQLERCWPMPMPTDTPREQARFWDLLRAELPAFVFWLTQKYEVPSRTELGGREVGVAGGRFGVRHWHHPEILEALQQFSAHVRLWQLIERSGVVFTKEEGGSGPDDPPRWVDHNEWRGTARELETLLKSERSKLTLSEKSKEVSNESWLGQRLKEAQAHWGDSVVAYQRTGKGRHWTLHHVPELTG